MRPILGKKLKLFEVLIDGGDDGDGTPTTLPSGQTLDHPAQGPNIHRRRHLGIQVDIQARELYLKFFTWFWGRGERYLRMETGVLHRISVQIS